MLTALSSLSAMRSFIPRWQNAPLVNDASLNPFLNPSKIYSHALNFGYNNNSIANGVTFTGVLAGDSNATLDCTAVGTIMPTNLNGASSVGVNSDILGGAFVYGAPYSLVLKGLNPKSLYKVSFFNYPWDTAPIGEILSLRDRHSTVQYKRDRAFYGIYSIYLFPVLDRITFDFELESHLYALVCEKTF
jgi:hypothetical protein